MDDDRFLFFPFNASDDEHGDPDRVYDAEDFAAYFGLFIGDGIYPNPSSNLQVTPATGTRAVIVLSGAGMARGHGYRQKEPITIPINAASTVNPRRDTIVLRLNETERIFSLVYTAGTPAVSPVAPAVVRNDDIYDLKLAEILVNRNAAEITWADITDTRLNGAVCGVVTNVVQSVDSTTLYNQYQAFQTAKMAEWNTAQTNWQSQANSQLTTQQSTWQTQLNSQKSTFDSWFAGIQLDIALTAAFDLDNTAALPGTRLTVTKSSDGRAITETLRRTSNNLNVARRLTNISADGKTIVSEETVYQANGTTVQRHTTATTVKNADGSITTEVV